MAMVFALAKSKHERIRCLLEIKMILLLFDSILQNIYYQLITRLRIALIVFFQLKSRLAQPSNHQTIQKLK